MFLRLFLVIGRSELVIRCINIIDVHEERTVIAIELVN